MVGPDLHAIVKFQSPLLIYSVSTALLQSTVGQVYWLQPAYISWWGTDVSEIAY